MARNVKITCPIFDYADFGDGPVKLPCTKHGLHTQHECNVYLFEAKVTREESGSVRHNVFESQPEP